MANHPKYIYEDMSLHLEEVDSDHLAKCWKEKRKKKTKAPGTLRDSKMLCGLYLSWGYGGCTCGKHQGYYDY